MADELKARLSVDTSEFSQKIAQAMAQAKVATDNAAEAFEKYGLDAAAGVQTAIEALAKDVAALDAAKASVAALRAEQDKLNASTSRTVSTMAAASGEIRLFEGNIPIRAVENFAAKTLGLGPIMQAAFPVAGAVAAGSILFEVGEKLVAIREHGLHAGEAIKEAFDGIHDKAQIANDDLRIQDDHLKDEIAKLSGHPGNGLQTALDEAIKRADSLLISLKADGKAMEELFKAQGVGFASSILSGVASTNQQEKELLADNKALISDVRTVNEQYAAELANAKTPEAQKAAGDRQAAAIRAAYQKQLDAYNTEAARLKKEQADSQADSQAAIANSGGENAGGPVVDNSAKIANIQGVADVLRDKITALQLSQSLADDSKKVGQLKGAGKPEGDNKASEEKMRATEVEYDQQRQQGYINTLQQQHDFWQQRLADFNQSSSQYAAIVAKITAIDVEGANKFHEALTKMKKDQKELADLSPEAANKGIAENAALNARATEEAQRAQEKLNAEWARADEIAAKTREDLQLVDIQYREHSGIISKTSADMQIASSHTAEYTAKLQALGAELAKLKQDGAGLDPNSAAGKENQAKQQNVQNQISQVQGQQDVAAKTDTNKLATDIAAPYLKGFQTVETGFMSMQSAMLTGHKTFAQAMRKEEQDLAMSAIQATERVLFKKIEAMISEEAHKKAVAAMSRATDAEAAAASNAIATEKHAQQGELSASTAAKQAYASVVGVPYVGPVLAPIAAAAAFVAVAAFETGGIIPNTGIAMVHQGEAVLPRQLTDHLMDSAKNGGGGGGGSSTTFHNTMNYHSHGGGGQIDMKKAAKMMQKQVLRAHAVMAR